MKNKKSMIFQEFAISCMKCNKLREDVNFNKIEKWFLLHIEL